MTLDSPFLNTDVGHIVTGDLTIVRDRKLRKLLQKDHHIENPQKSIGERLQICINVVREFKTKWAKREKLTSKVFNEWECTIIDLIKHTIKRIKRKH